jgi:type I restriction-modification system DNA methylase subunit
MNQWKTKVDSKMDELRRLVATFKSDESKFIASSSIYQETEVRVEFIDPLFELLGWAMTNRRGVPSSLRDVLREESQPRENSTKKPDYTFRIAAIRRFYVEAKRPSVDIRTHKESALQVRSYGYTAGLSISILTNFRTLRIYDTRLEPKSTDGADVGLLMSVDYIDYPARFEEIFRVLGRDQVANGSIEQTFGVTPTGTIPANASFLNRINRWRVQLAQDLYSRYQDLSIDELSDFSQKIINRIIFIRMCEDRGIEGEEVLRNVARKRSFVELRALFKRMDDRYNTGLFDVDKDRLQDTYEIDADVFLEIVDEVYAPNSPYSFSVLDADFLGQVYELFLGQRLAIDSSDSVVLENKPAYEHREVVTTPQPLVDEVVRRAFQEKFSKLQAVAPISLDSIKSLRVFDVAVGSSRFLLRAFDELIEAAIEALRNEGNTALVYCVLDDNYKLAFKEKKAILRNCLYGVDIDYNAVEVARFSLMVRLLEDETGGTLPAGRKILPDLDKNILHGNTVVEADFPITSGPEFDKTIPLDWALAGLPASFDIVVGNPPYVKTEDMKKETPEELKYYKDRYTTPHKQFDKYFVFVELALSKMKSGSWFGMVIPNKWITIEAGARLRDLFARNGFVSQIVDFGNEHLFEGKSAYVCLLILSKDRVGNFFYRHVNSSQEFLLNPHEKGYALSATVLTAAGSESWVLPGNIEEDRVLDRLAFNSTSLSELVDVKNGIQTSANDVFLIEKFEEKRGGVIEFEKKGTRWRIEKAITRPYINDSASVVSYQPIKADALMVFPYELSASGAPAPIEPKVMRRDFPLAMDYLNAHKARLAKRDVSPPSKPGIFYAYGRHQALEAVFSAPKIIYSVNQRGDKYGIDTEGVAYASGGTAGEVAVLNPKNGYALEFFLGLLNQRAIEFFCRKRGSPFGGGWYARGSAVLDDIPVPILDIAGNPSDKQKHDAIVKDVQSIIHIQQQIQTASGRSHAALVIRRASLLSALESKFNALWGLTDEVRSLVLPGEAS